MASDTSADTTSKDHSMSWLEIMFFGSFQMLPNAKDHSEDAFCLLKEFSGRHCL